MILQSQTGARIVIDINKFQCKNDGWDHILLKAALDVFLGHLHGRGITYLQL